MQKVLSNEQIEAFYHDQVVEDQIHHFMALVPARVGETAVTDVGGGCGFFAKRLRHATGHKVPGS